MKRNTIRVALTFATFSAKDVNCLLILVIVCMKNNTLFPNLPVTLASLTAIQTALQNAIAGAAHGGTVNTAVQSEAKDNAIVALRQTAAYVQSLAPTLTMSQVLTSGFDVVMPNNKPGPLDTPVFTLDNSIPAQLAVWLQAVANAKAYQIQISIGTGPWLEAGIAASTQNIVLTNLLSLTVYNVRIRAVGGSTKYSPWSATVSLLVT
jgi:hypothetical protein